MVWFIWGDVFLGILPYLELNEEMNVLAYWCVGIIFAK